MINRPLVKIAYNIMFRSLDKGLLEVIGPYGISRVLFAGANRMKFMQLGQVYYYGYFMIMFILISIVALAFFS